MTRSIEDADDTPAGARAAADEPVNGVDQEAFGAFYRWRHNRPFWGGLLVLLGGGEILLTEQTPLPVVIHVGIEGLAGYLVPAVLLLCGVLLWFTPDQRTFYSILAVLLSLGSWITSNLGGFFVGMALGLVGGSLGFAWARGKGPPAKQRVKPRRREPSGGLDLLIGGPRKSSRPVRAPRRRQRPAGEDTVPMRDDPPGQNAVAPDQPAQQDGARTGRCAVRGGDPGPPAGCLLAGLGPDSAARARRARWSEPCQNGAVPASARPPDRATSGSQVRPPVPDESAHDQSEPAADTSGPTAAGAASSLPPGRWLLLIYRVPSEPSRLRATVWRRIKSLGAIYLQNSAAALPASIAAERSLRKLRSEILDMSGTAVLMSCEVLAGEADVRAAFQAARDDEYEEIVDKCVDFIAGVNKEYVENHFSYAELEENEVDLVKLRTWLARVRERDVFGAAGLAQALSSLAECEEKLEAYAARVYVEEAEGH